MLLNVRPAIASEVSFAWPLFRDFIRENLFSGGPGKADPSQWNEDREQQAFSEYWNRDNRYIIEIDEKVVGWISTERNGNALTVENVFVTSEWQNKGVAERIFEEMIPTWKEEGVTVEVPVLAGTPLSGSVEAALQRLGFKFSTHDAISRIMLSGWS